jgi:trimethylamine monooxygenase
VQTPFEGIDFQTEYVADLLGATDYPHLDVHKVAHLFKEWEHHKAETILGYRDYGYRSTLTGTMAPKHHTRWMEAMDDSLAAFLGVPEAAV